VSEKIVFLSSKNRNY